MTVSADRATVLPPRAGLGLKPEHYETILETRPDIGFFEVHAENYMGAGGPPHRYLEAFAALYPLSLHGVGLSIGNGFANLSIATGRRAFRSIWPGRPMTPVS